MSIPFKPLPYMVLQDRYPHYNQAKWLRSVIAPKIKRKLPTLYYSGWSHGTIPKFVQEHKKDFPYFLVADIEKFYPSISHHTLLVEGQLAYKYLVGTSYVPRAFSKSYINICQAFFKQLPVEGYGLPLGSAMSSALAPLFWVTLLSEYKKDDDLRFMVFADDILVMGRSVRSVERAYAQLANHVREAGLNLSLSKVQNGRFSRSSMRYCGWEFAGGYVGIHTDKVEGFKQRIQDCIKLYRESPQKMIKKLNQKIQGFGHYYKYGNVKRLYTVLDSFIRQSVRRMVSSTKLQKERLCSKLSSLAGIWEKHHRRTFPNKSDEKIRAKRYKSIVKAHMRGTGDWEILIENQYKLIEQNKRLISLLSKIEKNMRTLLEY